MTTISGEQPFSPSRRQPNDTFVAVVTKILRWRDGRFFAGAQNDRTGEVGGGFPYTFRAISWPTGSAGRAYPPGAGKKNGCQMQMNQYGLDRIYIADYLCSARMPNCKLRNSFRAGHLCMCKYLLCRNINGVYGDPLPINLGNLSKTSGEPHTTCALARAVAYFLVLAFLGPFGRNTQPPVRFLCMCQGCNTKIKTNYYGKKTLQRLKTDNI